MKYLLLILLLPATLSAQKLYERPPINYETSEANDSINAYFAKPENLNSWKIQGNSGYLESFLEAFEIPVESQVLVYSKTSLQTGLISPRNPRALYFNDEIYVGWVPGGDILEISVPSSNLGTSFYTIDNNAPTPLLYRETHDCLRCHGGSFTRDTPGHVVRSVFTSDSGHPIYQAGTKTVTQSTPIEDRWGGWFVTGSTIPHEGNKLYKESSNGAEFLKNISPKNVPDHGYPTRTSDIIALMVLEHQTQAHTLISGLAIQSQKALYDQKVMDELLGRDEPISASTERRIKHAADKVIRCLFFDDEARTPRLDIANSPFAQTFQQNRPTGPQGNSLYTLKMDQRMFQFPLSYLVYSEAIANLPTEALNYLWPEIERILKSPAQENGYENVSQEHKQAILKILQATHPQFRIDKNDFDPYEAL